MQFLEAGAPKTLRKILRMIKITENYVLHDLYIVVWCLKNLIS